MKNRNIIILLLIIVLGFSCGCTKENERLADLDFTIIDQSQVPSQLSDMINNKKDNEFTLTYGDKEDLYIVAGYGKKGTGGYSIQVNDLFLTKDSIIVKTTLIGPLGNAPAGDTYPVVIIKTPWRSEIVEFQ